jgi:hypothetical protein
VSALENLMDERVDPISRTRAAVLTAQARLVARSGDRAAAYLLLTRAVRPDPDDGNAWLWLAGVSVFPETRRRHLQTVLRLDPDHPGARRALRELEQGRRNGHAAPAD